MKKFIYRAKDPTGKVVKGPVQAESENAAGRLLVERGYIPMSITEEQEDSLLSRLNNKISTKERIVFTRQFSTLIGAGLPLAQSLRTIAEQTSSKPMKAVIEDILASVESGKSLLEAFSKHPDVFDKVYLALIGAGEMSGTLDDSLRRIAAQQEKDAAMMSKIRGAMVYPAIVLVVIMMVVVFMLVTVVPQVKQLYIDLGEELPFLTQVMVVMADFLMKFWWLVLIIAAAVIYFTKQYFKTDSGIHTAAEFKLNVPLFNSLFRRLYMARFARTAQIMLATGVAMLDTLQICSEAVNNVVVAKSITNAAEKVKGGKALSDALKPEDYILPLLPQMINIGEQSGKIDEMLGKVAQVYEDELDEQIKALSTMIEPILMVFLAVVAGGMVGAILFPIYSLVNSIN